MTKKQFPIEEVFALLTPFIKQLKAPVVEFVALQENDPFKILIATILSSRTTDVITSRVIEKLFKVVTDIKSLDAASLNELEELIYPVGFYHQKAGQLKKLPTVLYEKFNGIIPSEIDELTQLPGVGRKTANLVRGIAFNKPAICVDVHVHRICNRWGYIKTLKPEDTEMKLRQILPEQYWLLINSYLVALGQTICKPRNPKCSLCPLDSICGKVNV